MAALVFAVLIALAAADSLAPPLAPGAPARMLDMALWTSAIPADIAWQHATPSGVLVLGTQSGLIGLDGASGGTLWHRDDLRDLDRVRLEVLPRAQYAVLQLAKGIRAGGARIVIDVATGHEMWDASALGITDVYGDLYVPSLDALLICGRIAGENRVVLADLESGRQLRGIDVPAAEVSSLLSGPTLFDTESTLVAWSGPHLVRYELGSGRIGWKSPSLVAGGAEPCIPLRSGPNGLPDRQDPRPLPPPASIHSDAAGRLLVAQGPTLHALDASSGRILWEKPRALCGRIAEVEVGGGGVLVKTMPEISGNDELVMLDGKTGAVRWRFPRFKKDLGSSFSTLLQSDIPLGNVVLVEGAAWVLAGRNLIRVDLASGEGTKVGSTWVNQEAMRMRLERRARGFLVVGQQELDWIDLHGKSYRRIRYEPLVDPAEGLTASGTALVVAPGAAPGPGSLRFGADYGASMERFTRGSRASSRVDSLVFVLTGFDDERLSGLELVAIGVEGGKPARRITVSKTPRFEVDLRRGMIFVIEGRTIRGFGI